MKVRHILASTAAVVALGLVSPVMAQGQANENNQIDDGGGNTQNEDSLQNVGNNTLNGWSNFDNDSSKDSKSLTVTTTVDKTFAPVWIDGSQDNDGNNSYNGNTETKIVAVQSLKAINTNTYMDHVVDVGGGGDRHSGGSGGYNSGNNAVSDNAFAAYAGILNASWNTGINANAQSATNIAAQGSVSFGDVGGGSSAAE